MPPVQTPFAGLVTTLEHVRGRKRWRSTAGDRLYEWDGLHGEWEVYTARGDHLGSAEAITGRMVKEPVRGRKIDV